MRVIVMDQKESLSVRVKDHAGRFANRSFELPTGLADPSRFRAKQMRAVFAAMPAAMAAYLVNASLLAYACWGYVAWQFLLTWYLTVLLLVGRMLLARRLHRLKPKKQVRAESRKALRNRNALSRLATVTAAVYALPWHVIFVGSYGLLPPLQNTLLTVAVVIIACCGSYALAPIRAAGLTFGGVIFTAIIFKPLLFAAPDDLAVSALALAFGVGFYVITVQMSNAARRRIRNQMTLMRQREVIEMLLEEFEQSTSDWLWEADMDGKVTYCSERLAEQLDKPRSEILNKTLIDIAHGDPREEKWEMLTAKLRNQESVRAYLVPVNIKEQARVWSLTSHPIYDEQGELEGFRGVGSDVTAESIVQELNIAVERAEKANLAKSRFLNLVSHELRTPLNAIIGFSELIAHQRFGPIEDKRYLDYASYIVDSSHQLLSIINDLLDVTRVESEQKTETTDQEFMVDELLGSITPAAKTQAEQKDIRLIIDEDFDERQIVGDFRKLKHVLNNLVGNAIKFTEAGGTVSITLEDGIEGLLLIHVTDTGIGVAEENIERIFEPFTQVDDGWNRGKGGVGLGLALAAKYAEAHQGCIDFESELGEGSRATLILPGERIARNSASGLYDNLYGGSF